MHLQVCMCAHMQAHGYTNTMTVYVSLSGGWLQKPDRCDPVSLSTSETWPMGRQRPRCSIMGPKCTALCRGRARTDSRRWWRVSGRPVTFRMRWNTSERWVETDTTCSSRAFGSTHLCFNIMSSARVCTFCIQVRDSLEKVRERMYGQFGGMQQSMQKLSQEIRVMNYVTPCDCLSNSSLWGCEEIWKCIVCVCRLPIHIAGVWSQRWGSGRQPWRALIRWTAPLYLQTSTCR